MPNAAPLTPRRLLGRTKQAGLLAAKHLRYSLVPRKLPARAFLPTPYFAQWESTERIADIIEGRLPAEADPRWNESGASTPEEYALWSWNACGMACLKMVLAAWKQEIRPIVPLATEAEKYGTYVRQGNRVDGLYYRPFCRFVSERFGLDARPQTALTLTDIQTALAKGWYVMLSVAPQIRFPDSRPPGKGGHLVLAVGYDIHRKEILLHNPSGYSQESQEATVPFRDLKRFFDNKGIIVRPPAGS